MKYTTLPHTNIKVSKICLGTMTWGNQNTEEQGHEQMDYALDHGVNFFDTAEMYSVPATPETYGRTEEIIGSWFKKTGNRDKIVLASKIAGNGDYTAHIRTNGFAPEAIREAVDNSLKRLQTDYIDLYQLHWPERNTNYFGKRGFEEDPNDSWQDNIHQVLQTLKSLIKEGKIRHIGLSNETPWGVMRFLEESKQHDLPRMITLQNPYSLLNRTYEVGLAEMGMRENMGLLAYSPLAFGVLSGKYLGGKKPEGARLTLFPRFSRYDGGTAAEATQKYVDLAAAHQIPVAQMALAFVTAQPWVTSNIIGATTMEQLKENINSIHINITEALWKGIQAIHSQIPNPAP